MPTQEVAYTNEFFRAELALGIELGIPTGGGKAEVTVAQNFTLRSVVSGLHTALGRDREASQAAGDTFDESAWEPSDVSLAALRKQHRPHLHYLRGIAGLEAYNGRILSGEDPDLVDLFDHQKDGFAASLGFLRDHDPSGRTSAGAYFDIAGGGGKSRIMAMLADGFTSLEDPDDKNRVLMVAADNLGIQTMVDAITKYAPRLVSSNMVGVHNGQQKRFWDAQVVLTTREMFRRELGRDRRALSAFDLRLADEAHTLLGPKTSRAVRQAGRTIIGFTGSAETSTGKVADLLPDELARRTTRELTMADRLAPAQFWIATTGEVVYLDADSKNYTAKERERVATLERRHQIMRDAGLAFFRDNRNGMFTCNTVEEAITFAASLNGTEVALPDGRVRHIRVAPLYGDSSDNLETLRLLQSGEIHGVVIVNLDTGWDAPILSFVVNGRLVRESKVRAGQRAARGARKYVDADGQIVTSQFFDLVDTVKVQSKRQPGERERVVKGRAILVPQLYDEKVYTAGQIIASPATAGKRRDFALENFPPYLRDAVTVCDGMALRRIPFFGLGALRSKDEAPDGSLTLKQAAFGLGVRASRLRVALAANGLRSGTGVYLNEAAVGKLERYFIKRDEPIV